MFKLTLAGFAAAAASLVPLASGSATGTLAFHAEIAWHGGDVTCPAGRYASPTVYCHPHPGGPVAVPGLGFVTQSYLYPVDEAPGPACADGYYVLDYTARLAVRGKGEIELAVAPATGCLHGPPEDTVITPTQPFTVTGGTGVYAGASGSGTVSRKDPIRLFGGPANATDVWDGTLNVPGLEFDLAPPTISGSVSKVVRTRHKTKRVKFSVRAVDAVDGRVPVTCKPRSGSRFKLGRTTVRCSASDTSANAQMTRFTVTVVRARRRR